MSILTALCLASAVASAKALPHVAYSRLKYHGAYYHVVQADVTSGELAPGTIYAGGLANPWKFVQQTDPVVAVTGTFFAPSSGHPVADVLVDGDLQVRGNRGSAIGVSQDGSVEIFDKAFRRKVDWSDYRYGLRGAVRLITNGKVHPNPKAQRFKDPRIWGRASRSAVGVTKAGKLLIVATKSNVTLSELGRAMVKKGAVNAVSLDGGSSTCLYYKGKMLVKPARKLSNMFVVCDRAPVDGVSLNSEPTPFLLRGR